MKQILTALSIWAPLLLIGQVTQTFSNPNLVQISDVGHGALYPSAITVSGMPVNLHEFNVTFDIVTTTSMAEVDLLLEAPNGQRIILMSDLALDGLWWFINVGIGTLGHDTISGDNITDNHNFQPANYGAGADDFPAPGPGLIAQPLYPNPFSLQDINPNGQWKLYLMDDTNNNSDLRLLNGWSLSITAASFPVCKRPGVPQILSIQDHDVNLSWTPGAGNTNWDVYVSTDMSFVPTANTNPTHNNLTQSQNVSINGLEPNWFHALYLRSDCGGGKTSPWVGPIIFQATIHPCDNAIPLSLCTPLDYQILPHYYEYYFDFGYTWVFSFTPSESGDYWMQFFGNSSFTPSYRLDNFNNCTDGQWIPTEPEPNTNQAFKIPNLIAGQTCWIIHRSYSLTEHQLVHMSKCPLRKMVVDAAVPYTDSLEIHWANIPPLLDTLEFVYGPKPLAAPNENTTATLAGIVLVPNEPVAFRNLVPNTNYDYFVRRRCSNNKVSCWQGPFTAKTAPVCSKVEFLGADTVTYAWAKVSITWQSFLGGVSSWNARLCLPGQNPSQNYIFNSNFDTNGQDTLTLPFYNIPFYQPLQLYLKAECSGNLGGQPWQGPFDIPAGTSPPVPVKEVFCGEIENSLVDFVSTFRENYLYVSNPCSPLNRSRGEHLFRYHANENGTAAIEWGGGGIALGNLEAGITFFIKPASQVPGNQGWTYLGCWYLHNQIPWYDPIHYPTLSFSVQQDSAYYILADTYSPGGNVNGFPFVMGDCMVTCPAVATILVESKTLSSADLRWNNAAPGGKYLVEYKVNNTGFPPIQAETTDTTITLTGLVPGAEYECFVRAYCNGNDPGQQRRVQFQLGEHPLFQESIFTRCNPQFVPPLGNTLSNYDQFELQVPVDGNYFLNGNYLNTYIYDGPFDPLNPTLNLMAQATQPDQLYRKSITLPLQAGKTYTWIICNIKDDQPSQFTTNGYKNQRVQVDGPAVAILGPAQWNGREARPHGKVGAITQWHSGVCQDTSGWNHYYALASDPVNINDDAILLSLKGYDNPDVLNALPMVLIADPGVSLITNPPAPFVQNPDGWYEMNRAWLMQDLTPNQQIDSVFNIRTYYRQADFQSLKSAIEAKGGTLPNHEGMFFHKINGYHNYQHVNPTFGHIGIPAATAYDSPGYWEYSNGPEASTSTWLHGTFAGEHYAEMVIRGFSGGGGGASVNGNSVFNPVSKTIDLVNGTSMVFWPNPNTGVLNIELSMPAKTDMVLKIADLAGRLFMEQTMHKGDSVQTINTGDLPNGFYLLQVLSEGEILVVEKFAKQ